VIVDEKLAWCGLIVIPVEDEMAANVRPQKLFSANRMTAWFLGTPLTSYPHRLCHTTIADCVVMKSKHDVPIRDGVSDGLSLPSATLGEICVHMLSICGYVNMVYHCACNIDVHCMPHLEGYIHNLKMVLQA